MFCGHGARIRSCTLFGSSLCTSGVGQVVSSVRLLGSEERGLAGFDVSRRTAYALASRNRASHGAYHGSTMGSPVEDIIASDGVFQRSAYVKHKPD